MEVCTNMDVWNKNAVCTTLAIGLTLYPIAVSPSLSPLPILMDDSHLILGESSPIAVNSSSTVIYSEVLPKQRKLEALATDLFGQMRRMTKEEQESTDRYIMSISTPTGDSFWSGDWGLK